MLSLRRTDVDMDEMRELHRLALPGDPWVGEHNAFWVLKDERGRVQGFCAAAYDEKKREVSLTRSVVAVQWRCAGIQRRMIRARVNWARKQGAWRCVSYTLLDNHGSIVNLLKCGFRFYVPIEPWVLGKVHYFEKRL